MYIRCYYSISYCYCLCETISFKFTPNQCAARSMCKLFLFIIVLLMFVIGSWSLSHGHLVPGDHCYHSSIYRDVEMCLHVKYMLFFSVTLFLSFLIVLSLSLYILIPSLSLSLSHPLSFSPVMSVLFLILVRVLCGLILLQFSCSVSVSLKIYTEGQSLNDYQILQFTIMITASIYTQYSLVHIIL